MALFRVKWLRRFIRRNTRPIPFMTAETWRDRLSLGYMFLAWNAFGFVCYAMYKGKTDWVKYHGIKDEDENLSQGRRALYGSQTVAILLVVLSAQRFAKLLNVEKATVIHFSGLKKTEEYEIENKKES